MNELAARAAQRADLSERGRPGAATAPTRKIRFASNRAVCCWTPRSTRWNSRRSPHCAAGMSLLFRFAVGRAAHGDRARSTQSHWRL